MWSDQDFENEAERVEREAVQAGMDTRFTSPSAAWADTEAWNEALEERQEAWEHEQNMRMLRADSYR